MSIDKTLLAISQEPSLDKLDQMAAAISDRKKALAKLSAASIKIGDSVVFASHIRPTYLIGLTAEVVAINRESVSVKCPDDHRYGRFRNSHRVRLPVGLIGSKVERRATA
jgi:hypothetical protein